MDMNSFLFTAEEEKSVFSFAEDCRAHVEILTLYGVFAKVKVVKNRSF